MPFGTNKGSCSGYERCVEGELKLEFIASFGVGVFLLSV